MQDSTNLIVFIITWQLAQKFNFKALSIVVMALKRGWKSRKGN